MAIDIITSAMHGGFACKLPLRDDLAVSTVHSNLDNKTEHEEFRGHNTIFILQLADNWSLYCAMARMKRVVVPGYPHHIVQSGVRSMDIFFEEQDRTEYLTFLRKQGDRFGFQRSTCPEKQLLIKG